MIDNDSGTYRPNADLLPILKKYLETNLPGLRILAKACDDDELKEIKAEQKKAKMGEGEHMVYGQGSDSGSISSSDEDDLDERAEGKTKKGPLEKGVSVMEDPRGTIKKAVEKKGRRKREKREGEDVEQDTSTAMPSTKNTAGTEDTAMGNEKVPA